MRTLPIIFLLAVGATGANAQMSVKDYQEIIATKDSDAIHLVTSYIKGIGDGFVFYGVRAEDSVNQKPLFCQPGKLPLRTENFVDIIDNEIKRSATLMPKEKLDKIPLATILLSGLQETFPCSTAK
jgi:hypothetical protein